MTVSKRIILTLICFFVCLPIIPIRAQDPPASAAQTISPEKQALMRELLELANSKKTIDAILKAQAEQMDKELPETIWKAVSGMKELQSLTPEQREEVRSKVIASSLRAGRRMYELLEEKIDFDKLIEDISLPLYDKYFTESELKDLLAFYKSPTGKKVIEIMPNLLTESMTRTTNAIMPKVSEIMSQMYQEETQRLEKEIQETVKTKEKPSNPTGRTRKRRRP